MTERIYELYQERREKLEIRREVLLELLLDLLPHAFISQEDQIDLKIDAQLADLRRHGYLDGTISHPELP